MKKYSIFLMAALALGFTACDDVQDVVSIPQSNPQEAIMAADGVTVAAGESLAAGSVNLQSIKDNAAKVAALNIVEVKDLPAGQSVKVVMELSDVEDFSNVQVLQTEVAENVAYVAPADWNAAHIALYGKNPMERTSYVRYALYALNGDSEVRLGYDAETKAGVYYNASAINVTPFNPEVWIEEAYYVVVNGDKANAKLIDRLNPETDRFDAPNYRVIFSANENDTWQIYPQSAINGDAAVYGPETEDATTGTLVEGGSGVVTLATDYVITVNMETKEFQLSEAIKEMYVAVGGNSIARNNLAMPTSDYVTYSGYIVVKDSFRIYTAASTRARTYSAASGAVAALDGNKYIIDVAYNSPDPIVFGLSGIVPMWATLNINSLTLEAIAINSIGVIGDATPTGWDSDTDMTTTDNIVWTITDIALGEGTVMFRANDGWDVNWGGTVDNLVANGDNIVVPEAGTYDITLDFKANTCTLTKK